MTLRPRRSWTARGLRVAFAAGLVTLLVVAAFVFRRDILRTTLDPKVPFQTYTPPPAPDYAKSSAWALLPGRDAVYPRAPTVAVLFIHPTTFNGGSEWNGPIGHPRADRVLFQVMIPNYASPYFRAGQVFAPRYRQGSLYTQLTGREDAREARRLAYDDVLAAFRVWRSRFGGERPFMLVGVEQGASIGARLIAEEISRDPNLRRRLVVAHLIGAIAPADRFGANSSVPACAEARETGCVLAYLEAPPDDDARASRLKRRALIWNDEGRLEPLGDRPALCVNPVLGEASERPAPAGLNLGAVNATNLEWGVRPAFLPHQVSARCRAGILEVTRPRSPTLKLASGWIERSKAPRFNLFYADLEADALRRIAAWRSPPSPPRSRPGA
jgi:hypothetical protein